MSGSRVFFDNLEPRTLMAATRIMPLGDSITEAFSGHASYRWALYNKLAAAGYDFDFVGGRTGVSGGAPLLTNFDPNHEGHVGWRADQVRAKTVSWATANKPDVVLLHIGTNDILQGQSNSSTITDIAGIIDNLRSVVSNVKILLAEIIPGTTNSKQYAELNSRILKLVSQKNTSQSPVIAVDQYDGLGASTDLYDGIHPNDYGERKIADKWYAALKQILPAPTPPPHVTYLSNREWTSMSNGSGSVEKDRSNGDHGATDGFTLALNGIGYLKGLGTHAGSDIRYDISGANYTDFRADIGVDDEVGNRGSVVFQVYVDGVLKYASPRMTGASATRSVVVPVLGGSTLRLVVTNSGDGDGSDHGDWANARLTKASAHSAPVDLTASQANQQINLSWIDTSSKEVGFRLLRKTGASGSYVLLADLAAGSQGYTDITAQAGQSYCYCVYAYNGSGASDYSNEVSVKKKH